MVYLPKARAPRGDRRYLAANAGAAPVRRKLINAVRAACARLGIDDDERRDLQAEVIGKRSMGDMLVSELGTLLDHLNRGWKGPMAHRAHLAKVKALWWSLYWLGEIDDPGEKPLGAFVRRQTGISALKFLDHRAAPSVIEALKSWLARAGVRWASDADLAQLAAFAPGYDRPRADRLAVLDALGARMTAARLIDRPLAYVETALALGVNHRAWTPHELDAAIRLLGRKWLAFRADQEGRA